MGTMATEFEWFRSTVTGRVGKYPSRFANRPSFVRVDDEKSSDLEAFYPVPPADEDEIYDNLYNEDEPVETEKEED